MGGQKYKLMAAVCEVATLARPGYQYKAILSISGKWLHCTDLSMSTENWPHGSKGVYLLFYHAQSPVTTGKEAAKKPVRHVMASKSVKPPTKPNLTAANTITRI